VEEPAEPVMPDDFGIGVDGLGQRSQRAGLFQGPMWPVSIEMGLVFGKNLYRFRTRHKDCDLRFGRMSRLRQDRGSWLFVCST
jgi:hypothetical protein